MQTKYSNRKLSLTYNRTERNKIMDEERFDQLYNRILDGDNWDYSTLDELICLVESDAREKGRQEMKGKAIEAFKFATNGYFIIGGTDYSENRFNEFIEKLNS